MNSRPLWVGVSWLLLTACGQPQPVVPPVEVHELTQNWSAEAKDAFYHGAQGVGIMPYAWFMALEQPVMRYNPLAAVPKVADAGNLRVFGFIESKVSALNPDGLPVGFARNQANSAGVPMLELTCAACHTGQLAISQDAEKTVALRIDGGQAAIDLESFEDQLLLAMIYTDKIPLRFTRFAERVLGAGGTSESKRQLKAEFNARLAEALSSRGKAPMKERATCALQRLPSAASAAFHRRPRS